MSIRRTHTGLYLTGGLMLLLSWLFMMGLVQAQTAETLTCDEIASPEDATAGFFVGQGNAYYAQGDFNNAIVVFSCALETDPDYVPAYTSRGFAYATQGNFEAALEDYNRALELDESYVPAYNNRGLVYTQQGRFGLALTDFDLAIGLQPDNATLYNNRGTVHAAEGNYDLAIADFEEALSINPDFATPHASLAMVYSAQAAASYAEYRSVAGETVRFPAGDPADVLDSLRLNRETGNFATWLPLQEPLQ